MLNALSDLALLVGGSLELSIVVKATIVVALGLVSLAVMRGTRASRRYLALAATFAVLLALPLTVWLAPPVGIAVASVTPAPLALASGGPLVDPLDSFSAEATQVSTLPVAGVESSPAWALSIVSLLRGVWILGVALFLLPILVMTWQLRAVRRTGLPWLKGDTLAAGVARAAGIRRRITVEIDVTFSLPGTAASSLAPNPDSPPELDTALPEQLGLKLEPRGVEIEVLVVDRVGPPTEN
jgi:hypothetical protein